MNTPNARPTGVEGYVVNTDKLRELTNMPDEPWALLSLTLPDGRMVLVCIEGVGWYAKDDLIVVPTDGMDYKVPVDLVRQALVTDHTQDLSTFIRTFGGRLETNFWLWYNEVRGKS